MIYLDNAGTTMPYDEVVSTFDKISRENFFNPSAIYNEAFNLSKEIDNARAFFLKAINAGDKDKLIFTSGATESNNIAIFGSTFSKKGKYLFSMGEHPAVYNCAMNLKMQGYDVDFIPLSKSGEIDYDALEKMCGKDVCFASIMLVSNETGAINDISMASKIIKRKAPSSILHVDAVQGFCKVDINVKKWGVDLMSLSSHKIGGLKGCGALYLSSRVNLKTTVFGGGQEYNLRSGTVNAPAILSFRKACEISMQNMEKNYATVSKLKKQLIDNLKDNPNVIVVSSDNASPYIVSLLFKGNRGETIQRYLNSKGIIVSTGSACSSRKVGNRILQSMGYNKNEILGALRVSFFSYNTIEDVNTLCRELNGYFANINA